ncbi:hypothetical protein C8Q76DRAFT_735181 [Earliella scabrosa]|nr:hypothetical protein C8Q76DRAFT_735181 [Earliella scabrosa]
MLLLLLVHSTPPPLSLLAFPAPRISASSSTTTTTITAFASASSPIPSSVRIRRPLVLPPLGTQNVVRWCACARCCRRRLVLSFLPPRSSFPFYTLRPAPSALLTSRT